MTSSPSSRWKTYWLTGFVILVLSMISVGGITRLTRSGLSIVEWKPVSGFIPPFTEDQWSHQFELYQKSPEYQQVNSHFTLTEYKKIFFWEYFHRLLGRLIFLFVLIPGLILWKRKHVEGRLVVQLASLVAFQGLVGWLMVKSGLNTQPHVSPFLLASHFFLALGVLLTGFSQALRRSKPLLVEISPLQKTLFISLGILLTVQIFYGCLTSGFKAGFAFNTYPLMGDSFWPPAGGALNPIWRNILENPILIQWMHRWIGASVLLLILLTAGVFYKTPTLRKPLSLLVAIGCLQVFVGILNLLWAVPVPLAALHQSMATLLVLVYWNLLWRLRPLL